MLQGPPAAAVLDPAAAAAFGFAAPPPVQVEAPPVPVWAELWPAVRVFIDVRGQWRTGPGGAVALDHLALPAHARPGHGGRRGRRLFEQLMVMESEALEWFAQQQAKG